MSASLLIDHYARAFAASGAARGLDLARLCGGVAPTAERFGEQELAAISRNVKLLLEDEFAGLTRHPLRLGTLTMMCEIATLSATLEDALERAFRFYALMTDDIRFHLGRKGGQAAITVEVADPSCDPSSILPEWWLLYWQRFGQWLIGEEIPILAVEFRHAPAVNPAAYLDVLGANCQFSAPASQVRIPAAMLCRPVVRDMEELDHYLTPRAVDLVSCEGVEKGLATVVRARLRAHLRSHQVMPKLEVLARDLGMCGQTLRRRLDAQGLAYRELKAEVRREVAIRCLTDVGMPIREISLRSGFAEPNGLSRALRSWAGMTPTDYREMITNGSGAPSGSA